MHEKVGKQKMPYIKLHTFNIGISNEWSTQRERTIEPKPRTSKSWIHNPKDRKANMALWCNRLFLSPVASEPVPVLKPLRYNIDWGGSQYKNSRLSTDRNEAKVFYEVYISRIDQLRGLYYTYCGNTLTKQLNCFGVSTSLQSQWQTCMT